MKTKNTRLAKPVNHSPIVAQENPRITLIPKGAEVLTAAQTLKIATQDDLIKAAEMITIIKTVTDEAEVEKRKVLDPLNRSRNEEINRWKPLEMNMTQARKILDQKMAQFRKEENERLEQQQVKLQKAIDNGRIKNPELIEQRQLAIQQQKPMTEIYIGGHAVKTRNVKDVEITDEILIPRKYLVVDMVALRKDVLSGIEVPGAKIVMKEQQAAY